MASVGVGGGGGCGGSGGSPGSPGSPGSGALVVEVHDEMGRQPRRRYEGLCVHFIDVSSHAAELAGCRAPRAARAAALPPPPTGLCA